MAHPHAAGSWSDNCRTCQDNHDEAAQRRLRAQAAEFAEPAIPMTVSMRQGAIVHPAGQPDMDILCPRCHAARIVTRGGHYFCDRLGAGCNWGLPRPATTAIDQEIHRLITGGIR